MYREIMVDTEEEIGEHVPKANEYDVQGSYPVQNHGFNRGGMSLYVHDDSTIESLAKNTNLDEPLYHVVTSNAFEALRPDFQKLPRKVLGGKIIEIYSNFKKDLKGLFFKFDGHFAISCDLWLSFDGENRYVCISCHWIRKDWLMERRVIGFEMLYPYDNADIASKMIEVLDEFNLKEKVSSISFDDVTSKEKYVEHLGDKFDPVVLEMFYHDRTYASVVDLCAQQIVDQLALFICPITELVKWFRFSPDKRREFRTLCKEMGLKPRKFYLDFSKNWKSTFDNLRVTFDYKEILTKLYNDCANHSPLVDSQWNAVSSIISLLEKFDVVSDRLRWVYDATCHLVIQDCITVVHTLRIYESDDRFCSVVRNIRSKWLELFPEIPTIYCVATILDPRIKVEGLRQLLIYYYETLGVNYDVDEKVAKSKNALQQLHAHYAPPRSSETKMTSSSGEGKNRLKSALEFNVITNVVKRKRVDDQDKSGDLGEYLFFRFEIPDDEDEEYFEILQWWEKMKEVLPVLSKIAKDVLCIPISTTIPKPKCCPSKRFLDEKRSRLKSSWIRVCICKKDWDLAEEGFQGQEDNCIEDVLVSSDSEADY